MKGKLGEIPLPNSSSLTARDYGDNCKFLYSGPDERFYSILYQKDAYAIKIYIEQWREEEMKFGRNSLSSPNASPLTASGSIGN